MPAIFNAQARVQRTWAVAVALLLVYVVWGTTYFAIGIALQTMPPLLMNAIRFLCAGGVMLLIALMHGSGGQPHFSPHVGIGTPAIRAKRRNYSGVHVICLNICLHEG